VRQKAYAAHYALLSGSTLWCLSIVAAPFLVSGVGKAAIYEFFALVCHQAADRSWHLLGEPLPVCIRCASIYFAFLLSLYLKIPCNVRWLRMAIVALIAEFVLARVLVDVAYIRALSGILFGGAAAPFIRQGIGELSESMQTMRRRAA
jgi:uncharacterized membrane protein